VTLEAALPPCSNPSPTVLVTERIGASQSAPPLPSPNLTRRLGPRAYSSKARGLGRVLGFQASGPIVVVVAALCAVLFLHTMLVASGVRLVCDNRAPWSARFPPHSTCSTSHARRPDKYRPLASPLYDHTANRFPPYRRRSMALGYLTQPLTSQSPCDRAYSGVLRGPASPIASSALARLEVPDELTHGVRSSYRDSRCRRVLQKR